MHIYDLIRIIPAEAAWDELTCESWKCKTSFEHVTDNRRHRLISLRQPAAISAAPFFTWSDQRPLLPTNYITLKDIEWFSHQQILLIQPLLARIPRQEERDKKLTLLKQRRLAFVDQIYNSKWSIDFTVDFWKKMITWLDHMHRREWWA